MYVPYIAPASLQKVESKQMVAKPIVVVLLALMAAAVDALQQAVKISLSSLSRAGESHSQQRRQGDVVFPTQYSAPLELLGNLLGAYSQVRREQRSTNPFRLCGFYGAVETASATSSH